MPTYHPDHNGECTHCDEPLDAHLCPPDGLACPHCGHDVTATVIHSVVVDQPERVVAAPCTLSGCHLIELGDRIVADTERYQTTEAVAYRLLLKFHRETDCGKGGDHWAECDALVDAFGWATWEVWNNVASRLGVVRR